MRDPWHPETDEEEEAMMERIDPEEREILIMPPAKKAPAK